MAVSKTKGFMSRHRGTHAFEALAVGGKLIPSQIAFTIATGATNETRITGTLQNKEGGTIAGSYMVDFFLSDAATGIGVTAATASGVVDVYNSTGTNLGMGTAKKSFRLMTKSDGTFAITITDTAKTQFYICASTPCINAVQVGRVLTANYG